MSKKDCVSPCRRTQCNCPGSQSWVLHLTLTLNPKSNQPWGQRDDVSDPKLGTLVTLKWSQPGKHIKITGVLSYTIQLLSVQYEQMLSTHMDLYLNIQTSFRIYRLDKPLVRCRELDLPLVERRELDKPLVQCIKS